MAAHLLTAVYVSDLQKTTRESALSGDRPHRSLAPTVSANSLHIESSDNCTCVASLTEATCAQQRQCCWFVFVILAHLASQWTADRRLRLISRTWPLDAGDVSTLSCRASTYIASPTLTSGSASKDFDTRCVCVLC